MMKFRFCVVFFFSSRRRHTRSLCDWSSDVCSSDLPFAREAVALAPGTASHRLLLITSLLLAEQLPDAEKAADEALAQDNEDTAALGMRGYIRQRQGKTAQANEDFDAVLKQDWLDEKQ